MKSRYSISNPTKRDQKQPALQFPAKVLLYLSMMSLSVVFVGFTLAYLYNFLERPHVGPRFTLPLIFHINTLIILCSSFALKEGIDAMGKDESAKLRLMLGVTMFLGAVFLVFQVMGWQQLLHNGVTVSTNQSASYLYLVSGLHAFHVLAGLIALGFCFGKSLIRANNPVADLLFVTDPGKKMRVQLVATFWHFIDGLWIYLYLFFLVMML